MRMESNLRSLQVKSQPSLSGWSRLLSHTQTHEHKVTVKHLSDSKNTLTGKTIIKMVTVKPDNHTQTGNTGSGVCKKSTQTAHLRFSAISPMMIFPPLLLVFSTDSAVLRPCSCFPKPWPSLKPYFCMILWATVPLQE